MVVVSDAGGVPAVLPHDNGNWASPAAIDLGESVAQAAVRETLQGSGIECMITGIVGICSDRKHVILNTSNGEARQELFIVLTARPTWRTADTEQPIERGPLEPGIRTPRLHDGRSMRIRVNDFLTRNESPVTA